MIDKDVVIGIDTSNYTTSLAIITLDGELVANVKRPLKVKEGERGLRQSDAVFAHVKNIPDAMLEIREILGGKRPLALGVSEKPRNQDGSYMPCFLSGVSAAESIGATLGIPVYRFSHQCGHIMAALYSSGADFGDWGEFGAFHISGGTTELLRVKPTDTAFSAELVGGTRDLNAGQIIDRVGVFMGLDFPAGPSLERLAKSCDKIPSYKHPRTDGTYVNLSGLENMAIKQYKDSADASATAALVFSYLADAIEGMCRAYNSEYGRGPFVFAGGVMCNSIIKERLLNSFDAYFAEPALSSDNAVGIAELTRRNFLK